MTTKKKSATKSAAKAKNKKAAAGKAPAKKTARKAAAEKTTKKAPARKKAAVKKTAVKKTTAKKTAAKKTAAKRKKPKNGGNSVKSATTASILGFSIPSTKAKKPVRRKTNSWTESREIKTEWMKYYQRLLDLRDRLLDQIHGLAKESAEEMSGYSLHMADSGTDNFDRDFALGLLSSDQDAMYEIEEALRRIERSTFGVCELTGKPIPKARLNAIPWARFTVEAQAQLERDGSVRQKGLGRLGSVGSSGMVEVEDDSDDDESGSGRSSKNSR